MIVNALFDFSFQMKLSLIFLLGLVCYGATYHQRPQYRNLRTYYQPRFAFHYPAIVNDDSLYFTVNIYYL